MVSFFTFRMADIHFLCMYVCECGLTENIKNRTKEIREASVGGGIKAERLRRWAVEWERFSLGVVDEFGEEEEEG